MFWVAAICVLSSISGDKLSPYMLHIAHWDKICHSVAFATGAVLLTFAMRTSTRLSPLLLIPLVVSCISLFGAIDEWHQLSTPGRSGADVWDWLADTAGATLGVFVTYARPRARISAPAEPDRAVAAAD
ncbi:MAG: hypothetical protein QOD99_2694 [Chthoniobacter sp.]|nr:hypothetical protein [Chthoniobacter sp.]